ncbi:MAG: hypothetical protein ACRDHW_02750 [Ktedonobacteraceae bacterium]
MCNCTTLPNGNVIVCDECAAATIAMLEEGGVYNARLINPLTQDEYQGIRRVVDDWLNEMQQGGRA